MLFLLATRVLLATLVVVDVVVYGRLVVLEVGLVGGVDWLEMLGFRMMASLEFFFC